MKMKLVDYIEKLIKDVVGGNFQGKVLVNKGDYPEEGFVIIDEPNKLKQCQQDGTVYREIEFDSEEGMEEYKDTFLIKNDEEGKYYFLPLFQLAFEIEDGIEIELEDDIISKEKVQYAILHNGEGPIGFSKLEDMDAFVPIDKNEVIDFYKSKGEKAIVTTQSGYIRTIEIIAKKQEDELFNSIFETLKVLPRDILKRLVKETIEIL